MSDLRAAHALQIKAQAKLLGFDACGIAQAGPADPDDKLGRWLDAGYHADMEWMARTRALRQEPRLKLPGAASVVVVAKNYHHERPPAQAGSGKIARYAWGRDYHNALRKPLRKLAAFLKSLHENTQTYTNIDSGPVMERSWAERAGIGWIGKNSLVLRRDLGSWFFLAEILSTLELVPDSPVSAHCGSCTACLDACPTQAIVAPQVVDSRLCISYQTIENRQTIPEYLHQPMNSWIFGCDICQEVCPWNRHAPVSSELDFQPRQGVVDPKLSTLLALSEEEFSQRFHGTPVRRTKHKGMLRNAAIAKKNLENRPQTDE